uniref:BolA-like protein n=1 Tax=Arcella intermedia TaxID=1963864 RepID=A0A6B2LWG3_9EUKA
MNITDIRVQDQSGSGSFFNIYVESPDFKGLSLIKQHQLVNSVLQEEIKQVHGVSLKTVIPK